MQTATTQPLRSQPAGITAGPADSPSLSYGKARRRIGTLEKALAYRNEDVLCKFLSLYKLPYAEAEDIFRETRRWLWMCAKSNSDRENGQQKGPQLAIDRSMIAIDEMWHTFILFTPDYIDFCLTHFGFYIHHVPNRKKEREQFQQSLLNDEASAIRQAQEEAFAKYEYVYDLFGEEVFKKWFVEYPKKYGVARLREMHAGLAP